MERAVVSFLGSDAPGVMHTVSGLLAELGCNIEEFTQTILQGEFAAIVIVTLPEETTQRDLHDMICNEDACREWNVMVREFTGTGYRAPADNEPFVITLYGKDKLGLIAGITGVLARNQANIENVRAQTLDDEGHVLIVLETSLPAQQELAAVRADLAAEAERLGVTVSLQHRDIFEAMHRVPPL